MLLPKVCETKPKTTSKLRHIALALSGGHYFAIFPDAGVRYPVEWALVPPDSDQFWISYGVHGDAKRCKFRAGMMNQRSNQDFVDFKCFVPWAFQSGHHKWLFESKPHASIAMFGLSDQVLSYNWRPCPRGTVGLWRVPLLEAQSCVDDSGTRGIFLSKVAKHGSIRAKVDWVLQDELETNLGYFNPVWRFAKDTGSKMHCKVSDSPLLGVSQFPVNYDGKQCKLGGYAHFLR